MTSLSRRTLLGSSITAACVAAAPSRSRAQTQATIQLGVLNDQSSAYRDNGGAGSVACVKLAVSELAQQLGLKVDVIAADHQNKTDAALSIARQWLDEGVDAICDLQNSGIALAVSDLVRQRDRVCQAFNVGTSDLTGKACTANTVHWAYDSDMLARVAGTALVKSGADTWFFIRADYAFGRALQDDATAAVDRAGGKVLGSIALPFPSTDFAGALLQAQSSGAKVIALANGGGDLVNAVKQAGEFGITQRGQKLASLLVFINNVHAMGLQSAQGLVLTETFYWDRNDKSRAFTQRAIDAGFDRAARPNMSHAACYIGTRHYLRAVAALGVVEAKKSGAAVVERMKQIPIEDDLYQGASIRRDGRVISPAYLFEVKKPAESKSDWDFYKLLATVPVEEAWRPVADGGCALIRT